jgi:mono/diheme cytochrome c family protein
MAARGATTMIAVALAGLFAQAHAAAPSRGELLYTTHCIACHSTQMHWRDQRLATDLGSLKHQVRLWQGRAMLSWTEDDIDEVTRYLDQRIYRFGRTQGARSGAGGGAAAATASTLRDPWLE